jgi:hypothetical protein
MPTTSNNTHVYEKSTLKAMPLFPQPIWKKSQDFNSTSSQQSFTTETCHQPNSSVSLVYSNLFQDMPRNRASFAFPPLSVPDVTHIPQQQYQFVLQEPHQRQAQSLVDQLSQLPVAMPPIELSNSKYATDALELRKLAKSNADSGTYTCTYHRCTLQFKTETIFKQHFQRHLQQHNRKSYRQLALPNNGATTSAHHASSNGGSGITTSVALHRNLHAGPYKCEGINPSTRKLCNAMFPRLKNLKRHNDTIHNARTKPENPMGVFKCERIWPSGKPCNNVFSRPYDLKRHEDIIHSTCKQKLRCQFCTKEITFNRNDSFMRHLRAVHPEIKAPDALVQPFSAVADGIM